MNTGMDQRRAYLSSFAELEPRMVERRTSSLHRVCRLAIERFAEIGFPTTKHEDWRFTNVTPIAQTAFVPAPNGWAGTPTEPGALGRTVLNEVRASQIVFVNGHYSPALSAPSRVPPGVTVRSLAAAIEATPELVEPHLTRHATYDNNAFAALNTAFVKDGAFVHVADDLIVDEPIRLLFLSTANGQASVAHPRNLILAGSNSQSVIVESYLAVDEALYFTNAVSELVAGENAVIEHCKLQRESDAAFHVATLAVDQARDSSVSLHSISLGGALVRNDVSTSLSGEGAQCVLNGLYMADGRQHVDNHTAINHATPRSSSLETYKGVVGGRAHAVFTGRIAVQPDAQKIVARQANKNLLLSKDALVNTKPQLQIHANDVKCFHGATVGMLDADALFYLRSRGMSPEMARDLLIYGFVAEVFGAIRDESLRDEIERLVLRRLPTGGEFMAGASA